MKPIIGVTAALRPESIIGVRNQYLESVTRAGGIPVLLPITAPEEDLRAVFDRLDGLLITGGADVDPARYGEEKRPECGAVIPERDRAEWLYAGLAIERDLPTLGICRGCQVLNVVYGGTLHQDIETALGVPRGVHAQEADYAVTTHEVVVEPGTLLDAVEGLTEVSVNSKHHQAVKDLAPALRLDARSKADGIIESFDDPAKRFMLGVQWHPEMLSHLRPEAQALFDALVDAAAGRPRRVRS